MPPKIGSSSPPSDIAGDLPPQRRRRRRVTSISIRIRSAETLTMPARPRCRRDSRNGRARPGRRRRRGAALPRPPARRGRGPDRGGQPGGRSRQHRRGARAPRGGASGATAPTEEQGTPQTRRPWPILETISVSVARGRAGDRAGAGASLRTRCKESRGGDRAHRQAPSTQRPGAGQRRIGSAPAAAQTTAPRHCGLRSCSVTRSD